MFIIKENIPAELTQLHQWLIWRYIQRSDKPKPDKVPHTFMGYRADVTNPEHWTTFDCALKFAAWPGFADGIGFAFSPNDPFTGIDLDDIWKSDADESASWAMGILERFNDTYGEASPSDCGFKIWCKAKAPRCGRWQIATGAIEIYDRARFFTATGRSNGVSVVTDHQSDIEALVAHLDGGRRHHRQPQRGPQTVSTLIPQGQRHNTLVSLAGTMWRRGMAAEAIEAALLVTDQAQCDPPHGPEHIRKLVKSMERWQR